MLGNNNASNLGSYTYLVCLYLALQCTHEHPQKETIIKQ